MINNSAFKKALIIGKIDEVMANLPYLLHRSGFVTDILTPSTSLLRLSRYIRKKYELPGNSGDLGSVVMSCLNGESYDWIIVGDDLLLGALNAPHISDEIKKRVLPVISTDFFPHIFSKVNLSRFFQQSAVPTPDFRIATTLSQAVQAADELGLPVALKRDQGFGGVGVYKIASLADLEKQRDLFSGDSVLIQKWMDGKYMTIDVLYLESKLVYFAVSEIIKVVHAFGPSSIRRFRAEFKHDEELVKQLELIGKALGVHGFVNMSFLISKEDKCRYFYEADLRPTAWLDCAKYGNEGIAKYIHEYFYEHRCSFTSEPAEFGEGAASQADSCHVDGGITLHYLRATLWQLLINRHGVWKLIPWYEWAIVGRSIGAIAKRDLLRLLRRVHPCHIERRVRKPFKWLLKKLGAI